MGTRCVHSADWTDSGPVRAQSDAFDNVWAERIGDPGLMTPVEFDPMDAGFTAARDY